MTFQCVCNNSVVSSQIALEMTDNRQTNVKNVIDTVSVTDGERAASRLNFTYRYIDNVLSVNQ